MGAAEIVHLQCGECKRRNYSTYRNKRGERSRNRLELKKYCKFCRTHTVHKEIR